MIEIFEWSIKVTYWKVCIFDLNLLLEFLESQTGVFVCNKFKIEESVDSELCVVTWVSTTRSIIRFRVKPIVNTLPFYLVNLLPCGLLRLNPPRVFTLKLDDFIGFPKSSYRLCSLLFHYAWYDLLLFNLDLLNWPK